jgi:hypothetical protein
MWAWARICWWSAQYASASLHEVSTIDVVTFSGVTSGGIVTSGTTCWTCETSARSILHRAISLHLKRMILWSRMWLLMTFRLHLRSQLKYKTPKQSCYSPSPTTTIRTKSRLGIFRCRPFELSIGPLADSIFLILSVIWYWPWIPQVLLYSVYSSDDPFVVDVYIKACMNSQHWNS